MNFIGIPEGDATIFTYVADKVLGGFKKALGWSWDRAQWAKAQDRYDQWIIKDHSRIRILGQTGTKLLEDIFTAVYVLDQPTALRRFDPEALREHLWQRDRSLPFRSSERKQGGTILDEVDKLFILGKPGAGKTTLLKYLAVREAQRGKWSKWGKCLGKLPIFVPLRQLADAGQMPFEFIVDQFDICHFPDAEPFVNELLRAGKALVLYDGLDEVPKAAEPPHDPREAMVKDLERFAKQYEECHIVITCRIAATEYTFGPAFTYLELADFDPDQVDTFVRNWFWEKDKKEEGAGLAERMLAEWEKAEHKGIRDLTRNPLLLALLCLTYEETLSIPARRVEIYEEALGALLKKWDSTRGIRRESLYGRLSLGRTEEMFARIAYDAFVAGEILFEQHDLEERLKAYLVHVPEMPEAVDIDAEVVLREIVAQHGIFAEQAHRLFSFAHLTFQEYYAARHIRENAEAGTLEVLVGQVTDEKWREVFLLTTSRLPDATRFLTLFEGVLCDLIARRPRLAGWLRWIDQRAATSRAAYRRPATRLHYACDRTFISNLDLPRGLAFTRNLERTRARVLDHDLDLALAFARNLDLILDLALDCDPDCRYTLERIFDRIFNLALGLDHDLDLNQAMERLLNQCQQLGQVELYGSLAALKVPAADAPPETWSQFTNRLRTAIEGQSALQRYRQLQAEVQELDEEHAKRWEKFDDEDFEVLLAYLRGMNLFYDCLQLAYTSEREGFEERIFAPPL